MKITAKYSVLTYEGKKTSRRVTYECPDFEDIYSEFLGRQTIHTALQQADEWLTEQDKREWMEENDIEIIFDWAIIAAEKENNQLILKEEKIDKRHAVEYWLKNFSGTDEDFKTQFEAVYSEMYPRIKSLSVEKQIEIALRATGVAAQAASTAYNHIINYTDNLKNKSVEELKMLK